LSVWLIVVSVWSGLAATAAHSLGSPHQAPPRDEAQPPIVDQLKAIEQQVLSQLEKKPMDAALYNQLGVVRLELGDGAAAAAAFKKAIDLDPNQADARANLSVYYFQTGREAAGEDLLRAALMIDPNNYLANYYSGRLYRRRSQPVRAELYLKKAVRLDPQRRRRNWINCSSTRRITRACAMSGRSFGPKPDATRTP
jgi:tetratricopeptide (TPR) repeat protein